MNAVESHRARVGRVRYSILALLVFTTAVCLILGWYFRRHRYVAEALLQVKYPPISTNPGVWSVDVPRDFEVYCDTQVALVKSQFVLKAALSSRNVAQLTVVSSRADPVEWLTKQLDVSFPGGETLQIRLAGPESTMPDYCKLIDAIIAAYGREVVTAERIREHEQSSKMRTAIRNVQETLSEKIIALKKLIDARGEVEHEINAETAILRAEIDALTSHWKALKQQQYVDDFRSETERDRIRVLQPAMSRRR